jgi:hypothetical protein
MFTLRMNVKSKGESPRERPRPRPRPRFFKKNIVNEVMPFLHLVHFRHASGWI